MKEDFGRDSTIDEVEDKVWLNSGWVLFGMEVSGRWLYRFTAGVEGNHGKEVDAFRKGGLRKETHGSCITSPP